MDEKDVVANFLNEHSEEQKDIFKEEVVDSPDLVEEQDEEKVLPFHKDPKVQKYINKQVEKALEGIKPSVESTFKKDIEEIKLPSSFIDLVGNDTPEKIKVLKDLSAYFGTLKGEARQEFLQDLQAKEQQAKEADVKALDELTSGFEQIEEDYGVDLDADKKTRAAFVEFLRKASPKNSDGEVERFADIPATWELFQDANKAVSRPTRAKELAARGVARSTDAMTETTKGRSWKDVDKYFGKLKNEN